MFNFWYCFFKEWNSKITMEANETCTGNKQFSFRLFLKKE